VTAAPHPELADLTLHLPLSTLALRRGGLVTAVLRRANLLADAGLFAGVSIEVLGLQPRLEQDARGLRRSGHLHRGVAVRSVLSSLDPSLPVGSLGQPRRHASKLAPVTARSVLAELLPDDDLSHLVHVTDRLDPAVTWWLRDGLPVARVASAPASTPTSGHHRPQQVELLDAAGRPVRRAELDAHGRVVHLLDRAGGDSSGPEAEQSATHRFIGHDGRCYLTVREHADGTWHEPILRTADGELTALAGMAALYRHAFEQVLAAEERPVLFSEFRENLPHLPDRTFDDVVKAVRHPGLRTVAVGHSNHRRTPFTAGAGATPNWHRLLRDLDCWDALVLLTATQRDDIVAEFAAFDVPAERIAVVPQAIGPTAGSPRATPDPDRVVLVARLHSKKRIDQAVRAFRHVADARPSARLHVYGFSYHDGYETKLRELVTSLDLEKHVFFEGFVPMEAGATPYDGACVTWLTSASEGFPLSMLESMSRGVPVVSFDIPYGPSAAIEDGRNGFLVPARDVEALAERTLRAMADPDLRSSLSRAARETVSRFSTERHVEAWARLLGSMHGLPAARTTLAPDFEVERVEWAGDRLRLAVGVPRDAVRSQLLVRVRGGEQVRLVPVQHGVAELELPAVPARGVVDLSLRADVVDWQVRDASVTRPRERRLVLPDIELPRHAHWQIYRTTYGSFSVKARPPTSARVVSLPRRVARRLRRRL
jgi:poly(glycerol-phosphate) alpha-glucosyltransferase